MKYWLLTTEYPPLYGGGISTYCYHTAVMLSQQEHSVTVFVPDDAVKDYTIGFDNSIRIVRFNKARTGLEKFAGYVPALSYEFACITMQLIRKEGKPDCIEAQEYLAVPYYLLQFKLLQYPELQDVPVVLTLHSPAFLYLYYNREGIYEFPNYWTGEMEISCIQAADWIIAPSRYILDEIKRFTPINEGKVSVIRNPYLFVERKDLPAINRNKIVFYGKLSPQKGVFELFSYMSKLWDEGFPHTLTVIGGTDKVYYPEMKTMGQVITGRYSKYINKGLARFEGKIPPEQLSARLSDAHVVLIPSANDNLPYAAIEAMCLGKVVLASRQGGQAEIIKDGVSGFLFDHEQPGSFEERLKHILSLNDSELNNIGVAAASEMKLLLNYEQVGRQKVELVKQLVALSPAKGTFPYTRAFGSPGELPSNTRTGGLLSVVIPYYNMGAFIEECVASVFASKYDNLEVLIVDDGSSESHSIQALDRIKSRYPAITVVHKKNEGLAYTRNYGASLAKGEFFAFLDADDKVHPDYYSRAIAVLKQYPNIFFVGAWVQFFGSKNETWVTWNPEPPYILLHNSVNSSSLVYKTGAFLQGGINDREVDYGLEDYESVISMLDHGYRGVVLPEKLFYYRVRKGSMYRALTRHKVLYSYQYISDKHERMYKHFASQLFNLLNANGPAFAYDNPSFGIEVTSKINTPQGALNKVKSIIKRYPALKRMLLRFR